MKRSKRTQLGVGLLVTVFSATFLLMGTAHALPVDTSAGSTNSSGGAPSTVGTDAGDGGFALQVSPSPLVATIKPGMSSTLELRIRNTGNTAQNLKMGLRAFTINENSGAIDLQEDAPPDVAKFVSFDKPAFSVRQGEIITVKVIVDTPASAGFTYSFAIVIAQQNPPKAEAGTATIRGTVAVFTLLNVDKPGAKRELTLGNISASKGVYEYLPAELSLTFKNTGNTLVQPKGTIYIQRHADDTKPLAAIPLNQSGGFILPGTKRTLQVAWNKGYPHYETTTDDTGKTSRKLSWKSSELSDLRIGRYVAKVVAVYDDGQRDVPLIAEVTFWVVPWRMLLIVLAVVLLVVVGVITVIRNSGKALGLKKRPGSKLARKSGRPSNRKVPKADDTTDE